MPSKSARGSDASAQTPIGIGHYFAATPVVKGAGMTKRQHVEDKESVTKAQPSSFFSPRGPSEKAASGSEVVITSTDSTAKTLPLNSVTPSSKGAEGNETTPLPSVPTVSTHEGGAAAPEAAPPAMAMETTAVAPADSTEISTEAAVAETTTDAVMMEEATEAATEAASEAPTESTMVGPMDVVCASENYASGAAGAEGDATKGDSDAEGSKATGTKRKAPSGRPVGGTGLAEAHVEALAKLVAQGEVLSADKIVEAFLAQVPGPSKAAVSRALREMAIHPVGRAKWLLTRETCEKFGLPFVEPPASAGGAASKSKGKAEKKKPTKAASAAMEGSTDASSPDVPFKRGNFVEMLFEESWYPGVVDAIVPAGLKIAFYQDLSASVSVVAFNELTERVRPSENPTEAGKALIGAKVCKEFGSSGWFKGVVTAFRTTTAAELESPTTAAAPDTLPEATAESTNDASTAAAAIVGANDEAPVVEAPASTSCLRGLWKVEYSDGDEEELERDDLNSAMEDYEAGCYLQDDDEGEKAKSGKKAKKKGAKPAGADEESDPWAQCDACKKWRKLPLGLDPSTLPEHWTCADNSGDPLRNTCEASQEEEDEKSASGGRVRKPTAKAAKPEKPPLCEEALKKDALYAGEMAAALVLQNPMNQPTSSQHAEDYRPGLEEAFNSLGQALEYNEGGVAAAVVPSSSSSSSSIEPAAIVVGSPMKTARGEGVAVGFREVEVTGAGAPGVATVGIWTVKHADGATEDLTCADATMAANAAAAAPVAVAAAAPAIAAGTPPAPFLAEGFPAPLVPALARVVQGSNMPLAELAKEAIALFQARANEEDLACAAAAAVSAACQQGEVAVGTKVHIQPKDDKKDSASQDGELTACDENGMWTVAFVDGSTADAVTQEEAVAGAARAASVALSKEKGAALAAATLRSVEVSQVCAQVPLIAERKAYGPGANKTLVVNDAHQPEALYRWEVISLDLLPASARPAILAARKDRTRAGAWLKALRKVLDAVHKHPYDEGKVAVEEGKVAKLRLEEQARAQKEAQRVAKEQEKDRAAERVKAEKEALRVVKEQEKEAKAAQRFAEKEAKDASKAKAKDASKAKAEKKRKAEAKQQSSFMGFFKRPANAAVNANSSPNKASQQAAAVDTTAASASAESAATAEKKTVVVTVIDGASSSCSSEVTTEVVEVATTVNAAPRFDVEAHWAAILSPSDTTTTNQQPQLLGRTAGRRTRSGAGTAAVTASNRPRWVTKTVSVCNTEAASTGFGQPVFTELREKCFANKLKLLQFQEHERPPYWGTWSKVSRVVSGRGPFKQDSNELWNKGQRPAAAAGASTSQAAPATSNPFASLSAACPPPTAVESGFKMNYEVDSEEEWEEEEEGGEDLEGAEDVDGEEGGEEEDLDYGDGWLRRDDDLGSDDEGASRDGSAFGLSGSDGALGAEDQHGPPTLLGPFVGDYASAMAAAEPGASPVCVGLEHAAKYTAVAMPWALTASGVSSSDGACTVVVGKIPVAVRVALAESLASYDMALPPPPQPKASSKQVSTVEKAKASSSAKKDPWAQCDACKKWRKLPLGLDPSTLPEHWTCADNSGDPLRNTCEAPQEEEDDKSASGGDASAAESSKATGTKRKASSGRPVGGTGLAEAHVEALAKLVAQGEVLSADKIVEAFLVQVPGPSKAAVSRALREMAIPPVGRAKWLLTRETCEKFGLPFVEPPAPVEKKASKANASNASAAPAAAASAVEQPSSSVVGDVSSTKSPQKPKMNTLDKFVVKTQSPSRASSTVGSDLRDEEAAGEAKSDAAPTAATTLGTALPMQEAYIA